MTAGMEITGGSVRGSVPEPLFTTQTRVPSGRNIYPETIYRQKTNQETEPGALPSKHVCWLR